MFEDILTIDFETHGITVGDALPPKPIGVAIKEGRGASKYYAFDHKEGNNSTFDEVKILLQTLMQTHEVSLGHNYKFDLRVLKTYFGIEVLDYKNIHDTSLLLFLYDPNEARLSLKDSAERLLNWPPTERDVLKDYLVDNQKSLGISVSKDKKKDTYYMTHLYHAPAELVGKYACADVDMTYALFTKLHDLVLIEADGKYYGLDKETRKLYFEGCGLPGALKSVPNRRMLDAYNTERELLLNLITIEEIGVKINLEAVKKEVLTQEETLEKIHDWLRKKLNAPALNFNAPLQVTDALIRNGFLDMSKVKRTPTGKIATGADSTGKSLLEDAIMDKQVLSMYIRQSKIRTCLSNFLKPWGEMASNNDGVLYTNWVQTRGATNDGTGGTRTGRLSSSPNFQNIPKTYAPLFKHEEYLLPPESLLKLPVSPIGDIPNMPIPRSFVIPRYEDHILMSLDYSQQELRILAHFENGDLLRLYKENPYLDIHKDTIKLLKEKTGRKVERDDAKQIAFSIIYGMGVGSLADKLNSSREEAISLRDAYYQTFPGLKHIQETMQRLNRINRPFRTIGGRLVYCQPPKKDKNGVPYDLVYKMLNTLCQGSAGDASKQATNNYMGSKPLNHHLMITVHDEFLLSVPLKEIGKGFKILKDAMESVYCDVKLVAEGKESGAMTWDELK